MSLPVQIDTTARKQYLERPEIACNDHLIREHLIQASFPLISATRRIPGHDLDTSSTVRIEVKADVEMMSAICRQPEILDLELVDHLTSGRRYPSFWSGEEILELELIGHLPAILRDQITRVSGSAEVAASGKDIKLADALSDLMTSPDEAREEGLPVPSDKALQNGEHVLREMYRIWPRRFEVYPMQEGEIAIDAPSGKGRSVMVLCDSQGGALCLVNLGGGHRRAHYSDARMLPDGFLREAISDMRTNDQE